MSLNDGNEAITSFSVVVGGNGNKAGNIAGLGNTSVIVGGAFNETLGDHSVAVGGRLNQTIGSTSVVSGGENRTAVGTSNWVAGALFQNN